MASCCDDRGGKTSFRERSTLSLTNIKHLEGKNGEYKNEGCIMAKLQNKVLSAYSADFAT